MNEITRTELMNEIDGDDTIQLIAVMNSWGFAAQHIPGSIQVDSPEQGAAVADTERDIVVYSSDSACSLGRWTVRGLEYAGHENVRHYAGGLNDWVDAGFPVASALAATA